MMNALFENLPLKLASLALSTVLWFVIAGEKSSERGLTVPVELQNFPVNLELTGDPVNDVEVRLRASPGIIHALGPGEVSAQINLAGSGEGERIIHLNSDSIRVPFGVRVVKVTPAILTLNFERTLQKVVPIRPRLIGRPAPGYEVAEVTSEPAEARIAGPKSRVQEVESAFTQPVSVEGMSATVVDQVSIGGVVSVKDTLNISFTIVGKYVSGAVRGAPRDAIAFPGSMKTLRRRVPPEKNDRAWAASRSTPICVSSASGELTGTTGQPLPRRPPGCVGSNPDRPSTSRFGCKARCVASTCAAASICAQVTRTEGAPGQARTASAPASCSISGTQWPPLNGGSLHSSASCAKDSSKLLDST